ncbi:MAG: zf-TFIIB domain-containing protein [Deltaproteobacteria bacterium]|nr:zf-TFIIB domain-containing protein [Deltaproteobacteria bacterium]
MESFLLYGICMFGALGLGAGRMVFAKVRLGQSRAALAERLSDDGRIRVLSTQVSHGGLELATDAGFGPGAGRSLTLQLMPNHWQFHAFDMGVDPSLHLEMSVRRITGNDDELVRRIETSQRIKAALEHIFRDNWVVEFCGFREGALVVAADTQRPFWEMNDDTVYRRFEQMARLAESMRNALELKTCAEFCPICPGQHLEPRVGALLESVCRHCQGRFLPLEAVEQLIEELGISVSELRDRIGQKRTHACPSCRTSLAPIALGDAIAEVCPGCGGMWLDGGELKELSLGRFEEIQTCAA